MFEQTPWSARVARRTQESSTIFTLQLEPVEETMRALYRFVPGQFNMLYLHGIGGIPISIVSDPRHDCLLAHTIRVVGRVTKAFAHLTEGDEIGVRGPFGHGWPVDVARGRDVLLITGGLGCAPLVSMIHYVMARRADYGRLVIVQGVKHSEDLIWRSQYEEWMEYPDTQVLLAADSATPGWNWHVGLVTELLEKVALRPERSVAMLCGPEMMMSSAAQYLCRNNVAPESVWLSMERNMHCANALCGHCQMGPWFVCRDGPVFRYDRIKPWLGIKGV